jgi:hypothetical protein
MPSHHLKSVSPTTGCRQEARRLRNQDQRISKLSGNGPTNPPVQNNTGEAAASPASMDFLLLSSSSAVRRAACHLRSSLLSEPARLMLAVMLRVADPGLLQLRDVSRVAVVGLTQRRVVSRVVVPPLPILRLIALLLVEIAAAGLRAGECHRRAEKQNSESGHHLLFHDSSPCVTTHEDKRAAPALSSAVRGAGRCHR